MSIFKLTKITTLLFILFVVMSCASKQQVSSEDLKVISKPQLLFLNYSISKNASDEKTIVLMNQIITDGKLKNKSKTEEKTSIEDLECLILDKDFNELEKISIQNPLLKIVEFVNDLGNFEKRILDLDSAQFSIRLQLKPKAKHIVINELTPLGVKRHITTKIN
ncbi:hypothetical protein ACFS5M_05310 [Lacinutrix iliipiscaria]|uniref:Lipoprotein n=1 Tax=Lacinutrix iliipiscaria TaxID=1230532 RepID=A0ABW5WPE0_9FLAO